MLTPSLSIPQNHTYYNLSDATYAKAMVITGSSLSILLTSFVVVSFAVLKSLRQLPTGGVICYMAATGLIAQVNVFSAAIRTIMQGTLVARSWPCLINGFFVQAFNVSEFATGLLYVAYYLLISKSKDDVKRIVNYVALFTSTVVFLVLGILGMFLMGQYQPGFLWCWLTGANDSNAQWYRFGMYAAWILLSFVTSLFCFFRIVVRAVHRRREHPAGLRYISSRGLVLAVWGCYLGIFGVNRFTAEPPVWTLRTEDFMWPALNGLEMMAIIYTEAIFQRWRRWYKLRKRSHVRRSVDENTLLREAREELEDEEAGDLCYALDDFIAAIGEVPAPPSVLRAGHPRIVSAVSLNSKRAGSPGIGKPPTVDTY